MDTPISPFKCLREAERDPPKTAIFDPGYKSGSVWSCMAGPNHKIRGANLGVYDLCHFDLLKRAVQIIGWVWSSLNPCPTFGQLLARWILYMFLVRDMLLLLQNPPPPRPIPTNPSVPHTKSLQTVQFNPFRSVSVQFGPFRAASGESWGVGWGRSGVGERGFCKGKE